MRISRKCFIAILISAFILIAVVLHGVHPLDIWQTFAAMPTPAIVETETGTLATSALSPDKAYLAVGGNRGIEVLQASTFEKVWFGESLTTIYSLAFSPQGNVLASAASDWGIILWDVETGEPAGVLNSPTDDPHPSIWRSYRALAFSPDGQILAAISPDNHLALWDVRTLQPLRTPEDTIDSFAWAPVGRRLGIMTSARTVAIWDLSEPTSMSLQIVPVFPLTGSDSPAPIWSPDGSLLVGPGSICEVIIWNAQQNTVMWTIRYDDADYCRLTDYQLSPDGNLLAIGSATALALWNLQTDQQAFRVEHPDGVWRLKFSPRGDILASSSERSSIITLWNVSTGQITGELDQDGKLLWVTDTLLVTSRAPWGPDITLWNMRRHAVIHRLIKSEDWQRVTGSAKVIQNDWGSGVWSPDGRYYAQLPGGDTHSLAVVDTQQGRSTLVRGSYLWIAFDVWSADSRYAIFNSTNQYDNGERIAFDTMAWKVVWVTGGCPGFPMSACSIPPAIDVIATLEAGFVPTASPAP